jgi:hypothetical protein
MITVHLFNVRTVRAVLFALATSCLVLASGCGGGGALGGGSDSSVSASFSVAEVSVTAVEGDPSQPFASATASVNYKGARDIFIGIIEEQGLLDDYSVDISTTPFRLFLRFKAGRMANTYTSQLKLIACFDRECREPAPGSPMVLPLRFLVTPNLQVQPSLSLSRTGLEAAPTAKLTVSVPPSAGALTLTSGGGDDGRIEVNLVGNELNVSTKQVRAGRYTKRVEFGTSGSSVYRTSVDIDYVVNPPAGGELPLALLRVDTFNPTVLQGDVYRQRIRVQRPTWVVDNAQPQLNDSAGRVGLRALGGDEFEVNFDSKGLAVGSFPRFDVTVSGREASISDSLSFYLNVVDVYSVGGGLGVTLDGGSTTASLFLTAPVISYAGQALRWTARSLTPWMSLVRTTGTTGKDSLDLLLDPAVAVTSAANKGGQIEISVDRPGASPMTIGVGVTNLIPSVGPALRGPLLAGATNLYVDGNLIDTRNVASCITAPGVSLQKAVTLSDTRFVNEVNVLQLTLADVVAGQDVVLRCSTALLTSEVRVPVRAAPRVLTGYTALPFNNWRSPQFAAGQDALFFAGDGTVARWALTSSGWNLTSKQVPGLIDAALYGNQGFLVGVGRSQAWRIGSVDLALTMNAAFADPLFPDVGVGSNPLIGMGALVFAADGAAQIASRQTPNNDLNGSAGMLGVGGILRPFTGSFANGTDPGNGSYEPVSATGPQRGGVVRSPGGAWVVGQSPLGRLRVYEVSKRRPVDGEQLPTGTAVIGVSEDGQRRLRSDGVLHVGGVPVGGSLAGRLPAGFVVGGYGLTGKGNHALVYGYRITTEAAGQRARDAAVWVFDITNGSTQGIASATLLDRIDLTDAVGCTSALLTGESCEHVATVAVAEGDQSAFVLGPRGVAALPLPVALVANGGLRTTAPARQQIKILGVIKGREVH